MVANLGMRWALLALLLLQPAPTLCAPLADCTDANALERVHALEMELKAERRKQESERRKQESEMLATVRLLLAAESDRRKLAAKILELEGRLNAADRAQDPSQYAVVPFKQPGHQRRRAQSAPCNSGLGVTDAVKDPHFSFAHGGRADFRGRNGRERLLWGARPAHSPQLTRTLLPRTGCCTASTLLRALRSTSRPRRPRKPLTARGVSSRPTALPVAL